MSIGQKGLSLEGVQHFNRRVILGAMHRLGACSRKEISVATGLDQATITRAIAILIDDGLVEEVGLVRGGRGRRSISLNFSRDGHFILCVRLQRRSFSVALFNLLGEAVAEAGGRIDRGQSPARIFDQIADLLDAQIASNDSIDGIGIALPGPFLERDERVILMTESPEWQAFDLVRALRERYTSLPVYSTHDAKAAGLTVWRDQAKASGADVLLYVSAGQGVGAALVVRGEVFRGSLGLAGELGHTSIEANGPRCKCGNHGCLELFTSRIVLLREVREYAGSVAESVLTSEARFDDVVRAYHAGDRLAVAEVDRVGRYLAQGITNCINFLNPDLVVIGDEYVAFGAPFLATVDKYVKASLLPSIYRSVRLELCRIERDPVLMGTFLDVMAQIHLSEPRQEPSKVVAAATQ